MVEVKFIKAHGLGNDMIIFDGTDPDVVAEQVVRLCDRKYGIGGDCVMTHKKSQVRFWNADGSEAKLCGNGCRCLIKFLDKGEKIDFNTQAGLVTGWVDGELITMKYPAQPLITIKDDYVFVDIGNKHVVIFGANDSLYDHLPHVDHKTQNVMFLTKNISGWHMDIYEAGVGETNACGSGAMAAAIAIWHKEGYAEPVTIKMKGGLLRMYQDPDGLYQQGTAEIVYRGSINL